MAELFYKPALMRKLLQKNAETKRLMVAREPEKTILACNGHWIVALGEPSMPLIYRQAFADSVPVGKQGTWEAVEDERGNVIGVDFKIDDVSGISQMWEEVRHRTQDAVEITDTVFHDFGSDMKPEREVVNKSSGETIFVDDEYLGVLSEVAKNLVQHPTISVEVTNGIGRLSIWANELMVAVLMPCKGRVTSVKRKAA